MRAVGRHSGWSLIVSAVAASLALGCYRPKYDDCDIKCGPRNMCPLEMTCVDGYCSHAGGCKDADAPPWTPAGIPNLVLWLESDRGIEMTTSAKVLAWRDQSPLHNDARQTTDMFAPRLAPNPFDGRPGLEFATKSWMVIEDAPSLRWGIFDCLVLVVYRATARCEGSCILQQLYRKQTVDFPWSGPGLGIQPGGKIEFHLDHEVVNNWLASPAAGYDSGRIHLVGAQRRSNWPSVRIDGAEFPSGVPSAVINLDAPGANVYFGAHGLNSDPPLDFPFSGYIGAIVAIQGPISATDLAQLETYLMVKYGATPGGPP